MSSTGQMLRPTVISIASDFPELEITQQEIYEGLLKRWYQCVPGIDRTIYQTRVAKRRFVWDPRVELAHRTPSTAERMKVYERAVLEVGGRSVAGALAGLDRSRIGSFAMASCTGYMGPTPDLLLAKEFKLRSSLRRTFVGHMGCFAAFNVLKVAMDSLAARPEEQVLINCTEFSSLHYRPKPADAEQAVIHGLFGDASASVVLGSAPSGAGVQLIRSHTEQLYDTHELMTWHVHDDGFFMRLSSFVPFVLAEHITGYLEKLLSPEGLRPEDVTHWLIHPGGPKILEMLAKTIGFPDTKLRASWHVLAEYGNCSSCTVLLVLEELLKKEPPRRGEYGVMMAFGPGLTLEGILIRF